METINLVYAEDFNKKLSALPKEEQEDFEKFVNILSQHHGESSFYAFCNRVDSIEPRFANELRIRHAQKLEIENEYRIRAEQNRGAWSGLFTTLMFGFLGMGIAHDVHNYLDAKTNFYNKH